MSLIMLCYNFMRTKNILGFCRMIEAIQNWTPDYDSVICAFKTALIGVIYSYKKPLFVFQKIRGPVFKESLHQCLLLLRTICGA